MQTSLEHETLWMDEPPLAVGELWTRPESHTFSALGPVSRHIVAFPRRAVRFQSPAGQWFIVHPGTALFINRGTVMARQRLDPAGSHCVWCGFDTPTILDVLAASGAAIGTAEAPLTRSAEVVPAHVSARVTMLHRRLATRMPPVAEALEDWLTVAVDGCRAAFSVKPTAKGRRRDRDLSFAVLARVATTPAARFSLRALADGVGVSVATMCAAFRAEFGRSIHATQVVLRVETAALRLDGRRGEDLSALALDLGFSSHSHFTAAFRDHFGVTPSAFRDLGRRGRAARRAVTGATR